MSSLIRYIYCRRVTELNVFVLANEIQRAANPNHGKNKSSPLPSSADTKEEELTDVTLQDFWASTVLIFQIVTSYQCVKSPSADLIFICCTEGHKTDSPER